MPREFKRSDRVADALQRSLAQVIQREVRDPRVGMVNINSVTVARDLTSAKIYVTFVGVDSDSESEESVVVLNKAASYIRNFVARDLSTRITPRLHFYYDAVAVHGQELSALIDKAVATDAVKSNTSTQDYEPSVSGKTTESLHSEKVEAKD